MSNIIEIKPNIPPYEEFEVKYGEWAIEIYLMVKSQFELGYLQGYNACLERWTAEERATNERLRQLVTDKYTSFHSETKK